MSRRIINGMFTLLVAGSALGSAASATVTASHHLWSEGTLPGAGDAYVSYRILVHVSDTPALGPDDWTRAVLELDLIGATFYQNFLGGNPPPPIFDPPPDLDFDTYYTSPGDYPNTEYQGDVVGIEYTADEATRLDTAWFDAIDTGTGDFVIAQFTVLPYELYWVGVGHLRYTSEHSAGEWFDYYFVIPDGAEPPPGDVDADYDVDLADLAALLASYDTCAGDPDYDPDADFDDDGCVDLSDLAALLANYGFGT